MHYQWVPPNYYETPLEERARELGCEPEQLCKTMVMENKSFDEVQQQLAATCDGCLRIDAFGGTLVGPDSCLYACWRVKISIM